MDIVIRPFVRDRDEELWCDLYNRAWREDREFTPALVEDLKRWDDAPWIGVMKRLIAELDGVAVGKVRADTDKTRAEPKGFIDGPDVVPEQRRKGIGTALMREALAALRGAGMELAELSTFDDPTSSGFLEPLGFRIVRRFSRMERTLEGIPTGVGEARDVDVVPMGRTEGELAAFTRLSNEAFKEHYNYTPSKLEETKFWMSKAAESGNIMHMTFATVAGDPVGYLIYGIDPKENAYLKRKRGGLWSIGVLKQYRCRGIARRLMIDAMNHLRREGMEEAELGVDETNVTNAKRVYESLGFAVFRRRLVWNKDLVGFDAAAARV
jgi:ribosomal protein S18 acetylase RimI-like enzyme